MNKKTFLDKLRKRLQILNNDEIEDIIEEYEGHINEKVSSGKTEEEAISDFGDFDCLVKDILSAYKINEDYENNIKEKNVVADFIDNCVSFVKDFVKNIGSRSKDDIIKFIIEFIILIIFIAILKLPVLFIEEIGSWLFERLISPFGNGLAIIWKYMIEIIYLILAVVGIVSFVKKRYMDGEMVKETKSSNEENIKKNTKKIVKEKKEKTSNGSFTKILVMAIKVCLIFVLIPAIFSFLASFVCLVIGSVLIAQGLPYVGILLCGLTYVSLNYIFLDLCFRFIFNKKLNLKALLISIITTVILFIVGIALSLYEVVNTTYINSVPSNYKKEIKEKTEIYSLDTNLTCENFHHTSCSYEIDESLQDNITATIEYYNFNKDFEIDDDLNYRRIEDAEYSLKEIYDLVINDLKQRKIYNYSKLSDIDVKIKVSSKTMKQIEENNRKTCEGYDVCDCDLYGCNYYNLDD